MDEILSYLHTKKFNNDVGIDLKTSLSCFCCRTVDNIVMRRLYSYNFLAGRSKVVAAVLLIKTWG